MSAELRSKHSTFLRERAALSAHAAKDVRPRRVSGTLGNLRILVGVLAFFGLIATPIERGQLPEPLDQLGSQPAHAQTPPVGDVVDGTPSVTCKEPADNPDDDLGLHVVDSSEPAICHITQHACPQEPINDSQMQLHATFYGFCMATITLDNTTYPLCADQVKAISGYAYRRSSNSCTLVTITGCSSNMHRISHDRCRQTIRRTWTCDANQDEIPRNEFNKCYRPPPDYTGIHPACQAGAPQFAIGDCATYVGQDFLRSADAANKDCANDYVTDEDNTDTIAVPAMAAVTNNDYWCSYDSAWLRLECHEDPSKCTTAETAKCVKRISEIGGCDTIAKIMLCRTLQAKYPSTVDEDTLYLEGCAPCVALPYGRRISSSCPDALDQPVNITTDNFLLRTLAVGHDFYWSTGACQKLRDGDTDDITVDDCDTKAPCKDPPQGSLDWKPSHTSGFAVVNTPIIISVNDIPTHPLTLRYIHVDHAIDPPEFHLKSDDSYYTYTETTSRDNLVRTWPGKQGWAWGTSDDQLREWSNLGYLAGGGECLLRHRPAFQLRAETLWPDDPTENGYIRSLFGDDALVWWDTLGDSTTTDVERIELQRAYTANRGPTDAVEVINCNYGSPVWCRWTPRHSGYYRLQATGAWRLRKFGSAQQWVSKAKTDLEDDYNDFLGKMSDGGCPATLMDSSGNVKQSKAAARDRDCVRSFIVDHAKLTPADFGLNDDLDALLSIPTDEGQVFAKGDPAPDGEDYGNRLQCPPIDLRVTCGNDSSDSVNITTTEYIGILVYETRTSTRRPSTDGQ